MPRSGVSHLAVFSHIDDEAILAALLQQKGLYDLKPGQSGAGLFRFFEQLMINRTNHWFLRPSAWERLPDDDKKRLADEVNIHERQIVGDGTPIFAIPEGLEVTRNSVWRPGPLRWRGRFERVGAQLHGSKPAAIAVRREMLAHVGNRLIRAKPVSAIKMRMAQP